MGRKKWTDEKIKEIVRRCDSAKENGEKCGDILREYGVASSMLCQWRKKYSTKKIDCPAEILEEFEGVEVKAADPEPKIDTFEDGRININDEYRREAIATALFMSGYTIWQTVEAGQFFINFQKD